MAEGASHRDGPPALSPTFARKDYLAFDHPCLPIFHCPLSSPRATLPFIAWPSDLPVSESVAFFPSTLRSVSLMSVGDIILMNSRTSLGDFFISLIWASICFRDS